MDELFWKFKHNDDTFATSLVIDIKSVLKGNPVKIGSYPRSCKLYQLYILQATVLIQRWEGNEQGASQKTCHIH